MKSTSVVAVPGKPVLSVAVDRRQKYLLVAWALLAFSTLVLLLRRWGYDDPYITLRYASNLLEGHGLVYNVGERVLSTTAPFYAIILSALGLVWPDLPVLSNVLSAMALVASSVLLLSLAWSHGQKAVGVVAALLLSVSPFMLRTFGAETCLYTMLILAGFYAYDRDRMFSTAGLLALAAIVRPDGVLAVVALGIYHLLRRRPVPWLPLVLYAGLVAIWVVGLWLYFGSPIPLTLATKQQQGRMAVSTGFASGLYGVLRDHLRLSSYWLPFALTIPGLIRVWKKCKYWIPLLIWTLLYVLAYSILGVSRYFWYYAPLVPTAVVLVAEGAKGTIDWLERQVVPHIAPPGEASAPPRPFLMSATAVLVLALLAPSLWALSSVASNPDPRLAVYRQIGGWLADNTPPLSTVGALEVGIIGYYAHRPMVSFSGLIQPEVTLHLTTYEDSALWAIQNYQPEYVVLARDWLPRVNEEAEFQATYRSVQEFTGEGSLQLVVYTRDSTP